MDEGSCTVIAVHGSLQRANAEDFRAEVSRALDAGRTRLVIDMKECESLDSTGLGALVWARTSARRVGGDAVLRAVGEQVRARVSAAHLTKALAMPKWQAGSTCAAPAN